MYCLCFAQALLFHLQVQTQTGTAFNLTVLGQPLALLDPVNSFSVRWKIQLINIRLCSRLQNFFLKQFNCQVTQLKVCPRKMKWFCILHIEKDFCVVVFFRPLQLHVAAKLSEWVRMRVSEWEWRMLAFKINYVSEWVWVSIKNIRS